MTKPWIVVSLSVVANAALAAPNPKPGGGSTNPCNGAQNVAAASALAQSCTAGFKIAAFPQSQSKAATYIAKYPVDCYLDVNQTIQCFFTSTKAACDAAVYMENTIENLGTKWKLEKITPDGGSSPDATCVMDVLPLPAMGEPFKQMVHVSMQNPKAARSETLSFPNLGIVSFAGPYRNQPDPPQVSGSTKIPGPQPGMSYSDRCTAVADANGNVVKDATNAPLRLNTMIIGLNAAAHPNKVTKIGEVTSDLAGYRYLRLGKTPCIKDDPKPGWCVEPAVLGGGPQNSPQVHHMVPAHYPGSCVWGKNSMANAVVISAQLNRYFSNSYPEEEAVKQVMKITPYPTFP